MATRLFSPTTDFLHHSLLSATTEIRTMATTLNATNTQKGALESVSHTFYNDTVGLFLYPLLQNTTTPVTLMAMITNTLHRDNIAAFKQSEVESEKFWRYLGVYQGVPDYTHLYLYTPRNFTSLIKAIEGRTGFTKTTRNEAFATHSETAVFTFRDGKNSLTITKSTNYLNYRRWLALLPQLMRDNLKPEFLASEQAKAYQQLVLTMATHFGDDYVFDQELINFCHTHYDTRKLMFKNTLTYLSTRLVNHRKQTLDSQIQRTNAQLQDAQNNLDNLYRNLANLQQQQAHFTHINNEYLDTADIEVLSRAKGIHQIQYDGASKVIVTFKVPFNLIDKAVYQRYLDASRDNEFKSNKLKRLYNAIFIEQTHILYVYFATIYDLNEQKMIATQSYVDNMGSEYMVHPHLWKYTCYGDNKQEINKHLRNQDLTAAILTTQTIGQQLNVTDTSVTSYFHNQLARKETQYKLFPVDGSPAVTLEEFYKQTTPKATKESEASA